MEQLVLSAEQINFQILNFIHSALQGKFAYLNVLQQLSHPLTSAAELEQVKSHLKKVAVLNKQMNEGTPPIRKTSPQNSPDEEYIFNLLKQIKTEMISASAKIQQLDLGSEWSSQPVIYQQLAAYFSWFAYQEEHFYKKLEGYHRSNNNQIFFAELASEVQEAGNNVKLSSSLLKGIKAPGGPEANFAAHLAFFVRPLPFSFTGWAHDANQLINIKASEFTFEMAEFSSEQATPWKQNNFEAIESGYWRAYGFSPEDAIAWKSFGFLAPRKAVIWRSAGFDPRSALGWFALGYAPLLAIQWGNLGVPPEAAAILISHGYTVPSMLPNDPEKIKSLLAEGVKKK